MYLIHIYPLFTIYTRECYCSCSSISQLKDDTYNNDFDELHDALDDDIDINNWSDVEESVLAHDAYVDHDMITVMGDRCS